MVRRVGRLLLVLLALVVLVAIALTLTVVPALRDARDEARSAWTPVRDDLAPRYVAFAALVEAVDEASREPRPVAAQATTALGRWAELAADDDGDVAAQVATANEIEGLIRRTYGVVLGSPSLAANDDVVAAVAELDDRPVPDAGPAFNDTVRDYESARGGPARRILARILGFEAMPTLDLGGRVADDG